jgi:hypothetical protein
MCDEGEQVCGHRCNDMAYLISRTRWRPIQTRDLTSTMQFAYLKGKNIDGMELSFAYPALNLLNPMSPYSPHSKCTTYESRFLLKLSNRSQLTHEYHSSLLTHVQSASINIGVSKAY